MAAERGGVSRRGFLALASAGLALTACAPRAARARHTLGELLTTRPFYVAHRGSGDEWPEHTALAYDRSAAAGAAALEVSVSASSDGVLVCHHDLTTRRLTGHDLEIATTPYRELAALRNDARRWLGPDAPLEPVPRLTDVLARHGGSRVLFVEDKQGTNTGRLLGLLTTVPDARHTVVWKQHATAPGYRAAAERGFTTWGYFDPPLFGRFAELAPRFDLVGIHHSAGDDQVRELVAMGRPVICWEVHTRAMRDRLERLGVVGMMCSNLPYVTSTGARAGRDAFGTGLRAPGDLPWRPEDWDTQPALDAGAGSVRLDHAEVASYCMGSMCPVPGEVRRITAELRWPDRLPGPAQHAGIAFGQADDRPYRPLVPGPVAGHHLVLRADGELALFSRRAGVAAGTRLAGVRTDPPRPGQWTRLTVELGPSSVRFGRDGRRDWSGDAVPAGTPGRYFSLTKNYPGGPPVEFRRVTTG